jgi:hypothetical protein
VAATLENWVAWVDESVALQLWLRLHVLHNLEEYQSVPLKWVFLENWWALTKFLFEIWIWFLIEWLLHLRSRLLVISLTRRILRVQSWKSFETTSSFRSFKKLVSSLQILNNRYWSIINFPLLGILRLPIKPSLRSLWFIVVFLVLWAFA